MNHRPRPHRWDDDIRDTRTRESRLDPASGWQRSGNSTFEEPSRGRAGAAAARSTRRSIVWMVAGIGVALVAAAVALWFASPWRPG